VERSAFVALNGSATAGPSFCLLFQWRRSEICDQTGLALYGAESASPVHETLVHETLVEEMRVLDKIISYFTPIEIRDCFV
jgi:hypothetical protein